MWKMNCPLSIGYYYYYKVGNLVAALDTPILSQISELFEVQDILRNVRN